MRIEGADIEGEGHLGWFFFSLSLFALFCPLAP